MGLAQRDGARRRRARAFLRENLDAGERITYRAAGKNWLVLSGTRGERIFYHATPSRTATRSSTRSRSAIRRPRGKLRPDRCAPREVAAIRNAAIKRPEAARSRPLSANSDKDTAMPDVHGGHSPRSLDARPRRMLALASPPHCRSSPAAIQRSSLVSSARANRRGMFALVGAMAAFAVNDMILKLTAQHYPLGEVITVRGLIATAAGRRLPGRLRACLRAAHSIQPRSCSAAPRSTGSRWCCSPPR